MSIIVWFDTYSLRMSVEETYVSQLDGITTAINGRYEESHDIQDVQLIFDYIQYKNPDVLEMTLFGLDKVLASTDRYLIDTPSLPDMLGNLAHNNTLVTHIRNDEDGIPKVRLTAPLQEDGITVGAIELLLNTSESKQLIADRIQIIIIVGISITLLLLLVLGLIMRRMLIYPLLKIREAAISV
jgi:two-component system NtrC family sensor kinase